MDDPTYLEEMTHVAYHAYRDALGGRDLDGRPLPEYTALPVTQHDAWRAALLAALAVKAPEGASAATTTAPAPATPAAPTEPPVQAEESHDEESSGRRPRR